MAERWVAEQATPVELAVEEALDVMARGELDRARVWLERLDEHAAGRVAAAAACELREQLEGPFLRSEVRHAETGVRVHHSGERDAGEVVALGDHLRADEHDTVGLRETRQRGGERAGLLERVGVEPDAFQLGELRLELTFQSF